MNIVKKPPKEPEYLQPFLSFCKKRHFPAKADIMRAGEPADSLLYLIEGSVSIIIEDEDGREIVLAYLNKGDFIGEMGLFSPEVRPTRSGLVRTRTSCELAEIPYTKLEGLFYGELRPYSRDILYAIGGQLTTRLLNTSQKVGHLAFLDVTGRIAGTLLDLCKQPDAMTHPEGMQIRITRQELGRIVGCSREMAGRVLKNLEEQGLIFVKGKTIVVFDAR
jgi:CRP/FNR family cyclic AMP-dependent transcriptional regulator